MSVSPPGRVGRRSVVVVLGAAALTIVAGAAAASYPLDGYERTRVRRLLAYRLVEDGLLAGTRLPSGALMPLEGVRLRLAGTNPGFDVGSSVVVDAELQAGLEGIFADLSPEYSVALLDITEPVRPRYAALRADETYLPGSVGKILVMTGVFAALAEHFPAHDERLRVLRESVVEADRFIHTDSHAVPVVDLEPASSPGLPSLPSLQHRPIRVGDRFTLFEWVDHMVSPSSNAAGATSWKQAMLIQRFGRDYPPSPDAERAFFEQTPKAELQRLAVEALERPLRDAGLDTGKLRQGTMFTRTASQIVPGVQSYASPRELLRWLVRLEQGRLVDRWSSLEMKRLLFFTRRRYRYAVSPALNSAAVYFKSGSFYQCREEPEYTCGQYRGNVTNVMNSVVIIEQPAVPEPGQLQRVYLIAMMSNVLKKNSAEDHRDIATEIDRLIARVHTRPATGR